MSFACCRVTIRSPSSVCLRRSRFRLGLVSVSRAPAAEQGPRARAEGARPAGPRARGASCAGSSRSEGRVSGGGSRLTSGSRRDAGLPARQPAAAGVPRRVHGCRLRWPEQNRGKTAVTDVFFQLFTVY